MFSGELKREFYQLKKEECRRAKHFRSESSVDLCGGCNLKLKKDFDETKSNKVSPEFKAANYKKFRDRLNWSGIEFPSGQEDFKTFSKNNPGIILSVYREQTHSGDLYLEYRSPPPPENAEVKAIHLVYATRINLEDCELEAHFLSVTKLSYLFGKILKYYDKKGNPYNSETDRNVCKVCNEIFAFSKDTPLKNQVDKVQKNFLSETPDEQITKKYSVGRVVLQPQILFINLRITLPSAHSILLVSPQCQRRGAYLSSRMLRLFMTNLSPSTLTLRHHMQVFHRYSHITNHFFHPFSTALCGLYDSLQGIIWFKTTKYHQGVQRKTTRSPTWREEM